MPSINNNSSYQLAFPEGAKEEKKGSLMKIVNAEKYNGELVIFLDIVRDKVVRVRFASETSEFYGRVIRIPYYCLAEVASEKKFVVVDTTFRTRGEPAQELYKGWRLKVLKKDCEKGALLVDHKQLICKQWVWRDDFLWLNNVEDAFSSDNIPDSYEVDMFFIDDVSSLISESCLLYDYQDVSNDIMDFAFHFLRVYVLNFERNVTLVISQTATVEDIFKFSKEHFGMKNHPARMFAPSRWFQSLRRKTFLDFSDNHDMNTLVEATRDTFAWSEKLSDISFFKNDLIEITFASENDPGSIDFPLKEATELSVGMTGVAQDKYGKWYHAQILSIVGGAEVIRRTKRLDIDVDETYFFIHWIGFKHHWNEWISSERVHRADAGFFTYAEAKILGFAERVSQWKWFPRAPFKEISKMPIEQTDDWESFNSLFA